MPNFSTNETRYRLRQGDQIVGYMRKIGRNGVYYSKDQYWWNGGAIAHRQIDEWTGLKDIDNRPIYEFDIVQFSLESDVRDRTGAVLWKPKEQQFVLRDLNDPELIVPLLVEGMVLFEPADLKFHAYFFSHPDLMAEWGIADD